MTLYAQTGFGQKEVWSFTRIQYKAGSQNWAIAEDENSRLYFANNEGLLVFDGINWQTYPVPNNTILRSVAFGPDGKLYAGAQDELGYFTSDPVGRLQYTSLKYLLPETERNFADVWEMAFAGSDVFFRTFSRIFRLAGGKLTSYPSSTAWLSLHREGNRILAQEQGGGIQVFENGQFQPLIAASSLPLNFIITGLVPFQKDTSLLCTSAHGFYLLTGKTMIPFSIQVREYNPLQNFTTLTRVNDTSFWAGTYLNGAWRINQKGEVREIIHTNNGLPNNTVRCIYAAQTGNAWLGLDNGIGCFALNPAISKINPPVFNNGAGYGAQLYQGDLYFALSTGLYFLPMSDAANPATIKGEPQPILNGLTWNASVVGDQLLVGRDDGCWKISNRKPGLISSATGFWNFKPLPGYPSLQVAAGNYLGIRLYEEKQGILTDIGPVEKFIESSRYLETDGRSIWVSHPYRGVFRIDLSDKTVHRYSEKNGLPEALNNHVFRIRNEILFATTRGIYTYSEKNDSIVKAVAYEKVFGDRPVRYLKEDASGNIWFVQDKMLGVADYSGPVPAIHYIPELQNRILSGFENIYAYSANHLLVGAENGFYHIDYNAYRAGQRTFRAYLTRVRSTHQNDSILFGGFTFAGNEKRKELRLPYQRNALHFTCATSLPGMQTATEFSFYLEGFDPGWSSWDKSPEKDYTNLPPGDYVFHVKARNSPSHESTVSDFPFSIRPPWHKTVWAYALYALLACAFLYFLLKYQAKKHRRQQEIRRQADQKKFDEEQKQTAYQHRLALATAEEERARLLNEKLEAEIRFKNAELASTTMNLVEKKEFILKLKSALQQLQKNLRPGEDNPELRKLLKVLSEEEKLDEEWDQFSKHFNSVHGDFISILKNRFPSLKPHELQLCAYLRMNLSSKDIAPLLSISLRGVEISRYRLRKKLNLPTETNLAQFLSDLR